MSDGNQDGHCTDCGLPVWWLDDKLVTREGQWWCFGPDRSRVIGERWHALPGMAQYVVPAPEGQVCHCLVRARAHIHQIIDVPEPAVTP